MRRYRIKVDNKVYDIEIDDPQASPVRVRVDGRPFEVQVEWEGADDEAAVTPEVRPAQPGRPSPAPQARVPVTAPRPPAAGEEEVTDTLIAPMPGTILSVTVREGDLVQPGQEVCVLEAMKMKNSIRSPRQGIIAAVRVSVGATVAYGDVLVRFQ